MEIDDGVVRGPEPTALNRRRFLGTAGALLGSSWLAGLPGCSERREGLEQARRRAVERRRRLILDDDGDLVYSPEAAKGAEAFVGLRLQPILGTPVDSIAWCIMWGIAQGPGQTRYWQTQQQNRPLNQAIQDPTPIMVEGIHRHGLEVFGSLRMNDTHDAFGMPEGKLIYPPKVAHPEWLLGDRSQKGSPFTTLEAARWSGLNFAIPEVREDRLWWVRHTAENYDLDGVDLNFFRMPWYFKPGEEEAGAPLMNDLIQGAHQDCQESVGVTSTADAAGRQGSGDSGGLPAHRSGCGNLAQAGLGGPDVDWRRIHRLHQSGPGAGEAGTPS